MRIWPGSGVAHPWCELSYYTWLLLPTKRIFVTVAIAWGTLLVLQKG